MPASDWQTVTLGSICDLRAGSAFKPEFQGRASGDYPFIKVSDMSLADNAMRVRTANHWVSEENRQDLKARPFPAGTTVFAKSGEALKQNRRRLLVRDTLIDNNMMGAIPYADQVDPLFFYYALSQFDFGALATGSVIPYLTVSTLAQLELWLPPLPEQRAIARVLGAFDHKIDLLQRMNETLDQLARTVFRGWFINFAPVRVKASGQEPTGIDEATAELFPGEFTEVEGRKVPQGWKVLPLDALGSFRNGLALRRFRPQNDEEERLPVVKIAQMRTGQADSGEWARADIDPECIIDDGDVIFSWSGSLAVMVWCGGRAALNQHLFRVTSSMFPKWFYLHWIKEHLPEFQRIASDKATMGNIQRHHLTEALCVVPPEPILKRAGRLLEPLLQRQIANSLESRTLTSLRDELLPRLLSGELSRRGAERPEAGAVR